MIHEAGNSLGSERATRKARCVFPGNHVPRVSIAIPVYNGENYLAEAIDSLLAQTFEDFELIISDNASTDRTPDVCREYAARDPRIRCFREDENRGMAWNFRRVFDVSRGQYFKWSAHDDVVDPTFLARTVEVLDRDPSVILCTAASALIDAQGELVPDEGAGASAHWGRPGKPPKLTCTPDREFASPRPHRRFRDVLLHEVSGHPLYGLIRADVLRGTGLLRPYCLAEKVLLAELALRGRLHVIPELLALFRWHEEQATRIKSVAEYTRQVNPRASRWQRLPFRVQSTWGYLSLIPRAGLAPAEQARCLSVWARYVLQVSKWKRALREALSGVIGAGDPGKERVVGSRRLEAGRCSR